MILFALFSGERPGFLEWLGLIIAFSGLVYLVFPGLAAPPLFSSVLMAIAGIAWGFYTLRGKNSVNPLADTTGNFMRSVPLVLLVSIGFIPSVNLSAKGIILAILSGAFASGIGYALWYAALKYHTATRAAILQLSVPILAAVGGVIVSAETISVHLFLSGIFILGGIFLTVSGRKKVLRLKEA